MTRLEMTGPIDREELKKEIRAELKREEMAGKIKWMLVMLAILLVLMMVPVVFVAALVAKSGLAQVPVLSGWLYEPVSPTRIVVPLSGAKSEAIMKAAITRAEYNLNIGSVTLYLTEQELTTILVLALESGEDAPLPFPVSSAQAVLDNETVELLVLTERDDGVNVPILARLVPTVQDGRLQLDSDKLTIGALDLPDFLADAVIRSLAGGLADGINSALEQGGKLEDVKVDSGRIELLLLPSGR